MYCPEKKRLLDEFMAAVSEYLQADSFPLTAVVGQPQRFTAKIESARKRKEAAKQALKEHILQHGC
jgi:hypothetical protein